MTSIGYFNFQGSSPATNINSEFSHYPLGGGLPGFMPQPVYTTDNSAAFADTRVILKQAWNTRYAQLESKQQTICTPFRAVNNAGDLLSRKSYSCGGSCQTFQSRPGLFGLKKVSEQFKVIVMVQVFNPHHVMLNLYTTVLIILDIQNKRQ